MKYECGDCGFTADEEKFDEARDLFQRLDPGGTFTDKECPKEDCGALAYPVEDEDEDTEPPACAVWSQDAETGNCASCFQPRSEHTVYGYEVTDDDSETVERIRLTMDGKEWNADTLQEIAIIMQAGGYTLANYDEGATDGG